MFKQVKTITVPEKKENSVRVHCQRSQCRLTREKTANLGILKAEKIPGQVPGTF